MAITVQNTYANGYARGYPGMTANGETSNRISRTVEDVAGIPFGRAAFRGVTDHGCTATPAAGKFLGIVTSSSGGTASLTGAVDQVGQYGTAGLLNDGVIFVTAGAAVASGDPAYVTSAFAITNASSGNTAIPAKFDETAASGAIVRLRVTRS